MPKTAISDKDTAEEQLAAFLAKYDEFVQLLARKLRKKMQKRLPGMLELVYDNYNFLVIGYGPSERPSEAIFSLVMTPRWVTLCFLEGVLLKDPHKLLKGGGNQVRNARLLAVEDFDNPELQELMDQAIGLSEVPLDPKQMRRLIIRSVSAKQRPRRAKA
jgi:Domain of unknown function (DU1801)